MTDPIGYVYIYGGNGLYKIGRAKDVEKRLRSFPKLLVLVGVAWQGHP